MVIVGGGSGAFHAVESLREVGLSIQSCKNLIYESFSAWIQGSHHRSFKGEARPYRPVCMPLLMPGCKTHKLVSSTKLSKALITDPSKLEWRSPADLRIKYGTILRVGVVRSLLLTGFDHFAHFHTGGDFD